MKAYIALWPDNSFSILTAANRTELFWRLDEEGDPTAAKVYRFKGDFHLTTTKRAGRLYGPSIEEIEEYARRVVGFGSREPYDAQPGPSDDTEIEDSEQ